MAAVTVAEALTRLADLISEAADHIVVIVAGDRAVRLVPVPPPPAPRAPLRQRSGSRAHGQGLRRASRRFRRVLVRLLLDTHTFLWFIAGDASLSAAARTTIADPGNQAFV